VSRGNTPDIQRPVFNGVGHTAAASGLEKLRLSSTVTMPTNQPFFGFAQVTFTLPAFAVTRHDSDFSAVAELLNANHLPTDGLRECFAHAIVARSGDAVVGCAALEPYHGGELLRSVAVDRARRGLGLGQRLTQTAIESARSRRAPAVFLLTTTAEAFFARLGFTTISRDDVPGDVHRSIEFISACPASAVAMRLTL